jgi:hypothetical protein
MSTCLDSLKDKNRVVKSRGTGNLGKLVLVPGTVGPATLIRAERGPLFTLPQSPGLIINPFTGELNTRLQTPLISSRQWLFSFISE